MVNTGLVLSEYNKIVSALFTPDDNGTVQGDAIKTTIVWRSLVAMPNFFNNQTDPRSNTITVSN